MAEPAGAGTAGAGTAGAGTAGAGTAGAGTAGGESGRAGPVGYESVGAEPAGVEPVGGPGPANDLSDVAGLSVGHHHRVDGGYLSGTTVVLAPPGGMVAGVDVRGGAPGTRETDMLDPRASVQRVHALVLTGGSAFGLAAASGVTDELAEQHIGFPVASPGPGAPPAVVPLVPAAVLFDLGRGGDVARRPDADFGRAAARAARAGTDPRLGAVGAGVGAVTCGLKGGLGMASMRLPGGIVVAALVVVNAVGSPLDARTGEFLAAGLLHPADTPGPLRRPDQADRQALAGVLRAASAPLTVPAPGSLPVPVPVPGRLPGPGGGSPIRTSQPPSGPRPLNTTLAVVATDADLSKSQCAKLAGTAHDGLARALNPVHTPYDGDTVFGVCTAVAGRPDDQQWFDIVCAAADVLSRAVVRGMLAARSTTTPAGGWSGYLDLAPSART